MKIQGRPGRTFLGLALTLAMAQACAQSAQAPAADEVATVQVKGVRDPEIMPYKDAYEFMTRLKKAGGERVEPIVRVVSASTKKPVAGLEVTLQGDNTFERVAVTPEGRVTMPISEAALADKAEFVSNQKKGALETHVFLRPKLPPEGLTYADIVASIEGAQRVRKELVPWYLRLFVPSVKAVAICYPDKSRALAVSQTSQATRPASTEHFDKLNEEKVFCADFEAGERLLARDSVISAPEGWRALYP